MKPPSLTSIIFLSLTLESSAFAPKPSTRVPVVAVNQLSRLDDARVGQSVRLYAEGGGNPFQTLLGGFLKPKEVEPVEPEKPKIPDFVADPSYSLAIIFAIYGLLPILTGSIFGVIFGGLNVLFASLLAVQATRLRFSFDSSSFELKEVNAGGAGLVDSGENVVVGGANRWTYESFVNWDFFPSVDLPILVYFKETQTPQDKWNEGPGQIDDIGGGQIHFFPAICNCKQLEEQFKIRGCAKVDP